VGILGRHSDILSLIMKIIFLNTWEAEVPDAITAFLETQSRDTDVFCLQEVTEKMRRIAQRTLREHKEMTAEKQVAYENNFYQATYSKNSLPLLSSGTILQDEPGTGLGVYVKTSLNNNDLYLCNFHGTAQPTDKLDDPVRLRQSEKLIEFFKDKKGPTVIGGDFNLFPETKSIQMFRENGYRDLIKEFAITTTRNRLAWERYPESKQDYADYVFVSPEITVKSFSVPDLEISDHLPLILEIE
jgi:endonuclease/exonuclease/phosphatase family metal-dependent hydrolase